VKLSAFASDGHPVAVKLPPMKLRSGESVTMTPADWGRLGTVPVHIVVAERGRKRSRTSRGRMLGVRFARVGGVRLVAGEAGSPARAEVGIVVRRLPDDATLSIALDVLRGAQVVTQSVPVQLVGADITSGSHEVVLVDALAPGRYRVRVRLLETVSDGPMQASRVVKVLRRLTL